jgi:pyruvate formate lyase activating enzyme
MNIRGLYKTSLINYPGKISAVIFTGGCNLRCGFCHNPELVLNGNNLEKFSRDDILSFLKKRYPIVDAVVITGGEPTLSPNIEKFCKDLKDMGISIKIDTNGLKPEIISSLIKKKLVDYAALDIKTSPEKYESATGAKADFSKILETLNILSNSGIQYEARTTCIPGLVTEEDIIKIGNAVGHLDRYYLQQFFSDNPLIDENLRKLTPYTIDVLQKFKKTASSFATFTGLRGI